MEKKFYELTNPQKSILLTEQFYSNTSINHICGTAILKTKIDFSLLEQAINLLVKNNDSFRLQLQLVNNVVKQYLTTYTPFQVDLVDVHSKEDLPALEHSLIQKPFTLYQSCLFAFKMFRFPDGTGGFSVNVHHIISDSWTLGLLSKEIVNSYLALLKQEEITTNPEFSYLHYVEDEQEYLESNKLKKDEEYWNNIFQTIPEIASIPSRYTQTTSITSSVAKRCSFSIPTQLMTGIHSLCSSLNITAFNFFMAVYSIYIAKICNLNDFVLATPILNRTNYKQKNTSGMFINIAPFRITIPEDVTFADFVSQVAKNSIGMLRHQRYPYEYVLENLRKQDHTLPNLYNILLSYQITKATEEEEIEYETNWAFNQNTADDIDVHLYDLNSSGQIDISYDYKISKYSSEDITCMHERILHIIKQIIQDAHISLDTIEFATPSEQDLVVNTYNHTDINYDKTKAIIEFFEEQVLQKPNEPAITFKGKTLTYLELNEKVNSLAFALRNAHVTNNSIVGVMTDRSLEMLVSILAVLKAGGAYIPIDPDYPQDRIEYMLTDSKATLLLTKKELEHKVNCQNKILVDLSNELYQANHTNLRNISKPDDLSYLIYTSGSTGKPKGVMLTQKNLSNFYASMLQTIAYLKDKQPHSIVSITTLSFDIFGFETLISLCSGLHLYITDYYEQKVTEQLEKLIKEHKIEIIQTTPSVMRFHLDNVVNPKNLASLKYVMLAGEQLPKTLVERIKDMVPNCTIYNGYGPSETTIFSSVQDVTNLDTINIGRPIGNTQFYILDKNKKVLPPYCVGEIYIAGDGVGKGYLYQPELTKASFLNNPFHDHSFLYKTGDLGRWIDGGFVECKGRIDHQVKLRGLRVELGEIENKINTFKADNKTKSAVIVKKENGKDTLYAFIESATTVDLADLKAHLLKNLPNYMIPSHFVFIPKLPQTPNGKIDRKILQTYDTTVISNKNSYQPPRNELETAILKTITTKLQVKDFGIDSNIFDYGADSLMIINILTDLFQYDLNLKVYDFYKYPTVRELYDNLLIEEKRKENVEISRYNQITQIVRSFTTTTTCQPISEKKTVLLTGATGFLGSHLLAQLLDCPEKLNKVYCFVRSKANLNPTKRLLDKFHFYFGNRYDSLINQYVKVVPSEIVKEGFGIPKEQLEELANTVDLVLHSAANVKHYGKYEDFEMANVTATKNIISFCLVHNIPLHYISTMTVSGNYLLAQNDMSITFNENSFFENQNFDQNVYSKSKLLAEAEIIENMEKGLKATIYRMGDLLGRYVDGGFQENIDKNATYLRLKSIMDIGCIPDSIAQNPLEFTPIDCAAKAVVTIIWSTAPYNRIFNIYNPNMIITDDLINYINELGYVVSVVSKEDFMNTILLLSSDINNQKKLSGIINDFTKDNDLVYSHIIKQDNTITCKYLEHLGFTWPNLSLDYIKKLITYMKKVGFIQ